MSAFKSTFVTGFCLSYSTMGVLPGAELRLLDVSLSRSQDVEVKFVPSSLLLSSLSTSPRPSPNSPLSFYWSHLFHLIFLRLDNFSCGENSFTPKSFLRHIFLLKGNYCSTSLSLHMHWFASVSYAEMLFYLRKVQTNPPNLLMLPTFRSAILPVRNFKGLQYLKIIW